MGIDRVPWIPFEAKTFLDGIVGKDKAVFEWGCGGSTLYFADTCASVVSVEDSAEWISKVAIELGGDILATDCIVTVSNDALDATLYHVERGEGILGSDTSNPAHYVERNILGANFKEFARAIDGYPDEYFDIVMVDSFARPSCITHALPKLKSGGWLVLDNSDREYYLSQIGYVINSWDKRKFCGPGPYNTYEWCCSFWRKP
jgi:hypothetical protein